MIFWIQTRFIRENRKHGNNSRNVLVNAQTTAIL